LNLFDRDLLPLIKSIEFTHFGVIKPAPLDQHFIKKYVDWNMSGFNAGMEYLSRPSTRKTRVDPSQFLPEARSIIVLAARYPVDRDDDFHPGLHGKIASFAWGQDYHHVLQVKLEILSAEIAKLSGKEHNSRIAIDSSPILEKPLAFEAGLGWIGRHSCLIHPIHGSFFFLANLFTTLEIEPTGTQMPSRCGDCHRCMDACPTGCILPDHTIDARRCISYLTIENKDVIPVELREKIGQHLFGCDVCQAVCPWNRKPDDSSVILDLQAKSESNIWFDLTRIVSLSHDEFKENFQDSPVLRAKRNGLIRNACVVLGNTHSDEATPHLARLLREEPFPLIRGHAAWGLGTINSSNAREVLSNCLSTETEPDVLDEIKSALSMH
jgi:epoxyqueuosine reductase